MQEPLYFHSPTKGIVKLVISSALADPTNPEFYLEMDRLDFEQEWQERMDRIFLNDIIKGFNGTFDDWADINKDIITYIVEKTREDF